MCDCIKAFDERLAEFNAEIMLPIFTVGGAPAAPFITTYKKGRSRKKVPLVQATYCPFCGDKYAKEPTDAA